jgi:hypothetical protein
MQQTLEWISYSLLHQILRSGSWLGAPHRTDPELLGKITPRKQEAKLTNCSHQEASYQIGQRKESLWAVC